MTDRKAKNPKRKTNGKKPVYKLNGYTFKNEFELNGFKEVKGHAPAGAIVSYETDTFQYTIPSSYTPDIPVEFKDGRKMFIEMKGFLRKEHQEALRYTKEQHPELDIRLVFQDDKPGRVQYRKMKPSEWAAKYKFPCAIGNIPEEWFEE